MNINIRKIQSSDITKINNIFRQTLLAHKQALPDLFQIPDNDNWNIQFLEKLRENENGLILIADISGKLVGYLISYLKNLPTDAPFYQHRKVLYIEDISIEKSYQHKGVGRLLTLKCEEWAREHGYTDIELNVYECNKQAQQFYSKLGYETLLQSLRKKL